MMHRQNESKMWGQRSTRKQVRVVCPPPQSRRGRGDTAQTDTLHVSNCEQKPKRPCGWGEGSPCPATKPAPVKAAEKCRAMAQLGSPGRGTTKKKRGRGVHQGTCPPPTGGERGRIRGDLQQSARKRRFRVYQQDFWQGGVPAHSTHPPCLPAHNTQGRGVKTSSKRSQGVNPEPPTPSHPTTPPNHS